MYVDVLYLCLVAPETRKTGAIYGYEPPHGCWESNLGLLEEQLVLLTIEVYLQTSPLPQVDLEELTAFLTGLHCPFFLLEYFSNV